MIQGEQSQEGQRKGSIFIDGRVKFLPRSDVVPSPLRSLIDEVDSVSTAASFGRGEKVAPSAPEEEVDDVTERVRVSDFLGGDIIFGTTVEDMRSVACVIEVSTRAFSPRIGGEGAVLTSGSCVRYASGYNKTSFEAAKMSSLED